MPGGVPGIGVIARVRSCWIRITYDPEVDALCIRFKNGSVGTEHVAEGVVMENVAPRPTSRRRVVWKP